MDGLKNHIALVHEGGGKDHICETCGASYRSAVSLKRHIKNIHEGKKDHKCDACGKSYIDICGLKKHIIMVHEGRKDHCCDYCGKAFSL